MKELDKVLDDNEKIFWGGKPNFWPFFFGRSTFAFVIGLILLFFMFPFIVISLLLVLMGLPFALIFLLPMIFFILLLTAGIMVYNWLLYKNVYYAITSKRVIIQTGLIGRDFITVDFDQITHAEVNVGVFDKMFSSSSGSIMISSGSARTYILSNIKDPYNAFKFFKKVSFDVKTDIEYPNKLRPKTNPGYGTGYKPSKRR